VSAELLAHIGPFLRAFTDRLDAQRRVYGWGEFSRSPGELLDVMQRDSERVEKLYADYASIEEMKKKLCRKCGWPIIYLQGEAKREDGGLCAQCALGVKPAPEKAK
jgi:hypothetical protein